RHPRYLHDHPAHHCGALVPRLPQRRAALGRDHDGVRGGLRVAAPGVPSPRVEPDRTEPPPPPSARPPSDAPHAGADAALELQRHGAARWLAPRDDLPRPGAVVIGSAGRRTRGAPALANGARAGLPDVEPARSLDQREVELEERIMRRGLDHPTDAAARDDGHDEAAGRRIIGHLARPGAYAELVVIGPGEGMNDAATVATQIVALRGSCRDRREETAVGDDRAERMEPRAPVGSDGRQIRDREGLRGARSGLLPEPSESDDS